MKEGKIRIEIVEHPELGFDCEPGGSLLSALTSHGIPILSVCGGNGYCGACKVKVLGGGGEMTAAERRHLSENQILERVRLSCQVKVERDITVEVPAGVVAAREWRCTVVSSRNVATFIKEIVLAMPEGEKLRFRAGSYIGVERPPGTVRYEDFDIDEKYLEEWERGELRRCVSTCDKPVSRTYSLANHPGENGIAMLNVRIAAPPYDAMHARPGVVSSYMFSLKPGDSVKVSGPFGDFFTKDTDAEICFVAGGAGMAPMRSHILDQLVRLKSRRKISYWYGARSLNDAFYMEEFDRLAVENDNFEWHLVLSQPKESDRWSGPTGSINRVLREMYLKKHPSPKDVEYYLCGPPLMVAAVKDTLIEEGIDAGNIFFDDFN